MDAKAVSEAVSAVFGDLPHPDVPELKVHQYDAYGRVAARMFFDANPHPDQVRQAYHTLTHAGLAPGEFERLWDVAKPLANHLLERDPTIHDLMQLVAQPPQQVHAYYESHPHPDAPGVTAGEMELYRKHATPISRRVIGRDPNHIELGRFASGGYGIADIVAHYMDDGSQ